MIVFARALPMPDGLIHGTEPLMLFPIGEPRQNDGRPWKFTVEDLQIVADEFASRLEPMPILYAHGDDPSKGKKAAGWVDAVQLRPDGLYGAVRWTEEAKAAVQAGEWGFRSPGFDAVTDVDGFIRPRKLAEVSLVNDPAIGGMPPVRASQTPEVQRMAKAATQGALEILAGVRDALGLDAAASVADIAAAFKKCIDGEMMEEPEMPEETPAAEVTPPPAVPAAIQTSSEADTIKAEFDAADKRARVIALIKRAELDGRITAASRNAAIELASVKPDAFSTFVSSLPAAAPAAGQLVTATAQDRSPKAPATYAEQIRARRIAVMAGGN